MNYLFVFRVPNILSLPQHQRPRNADLRLVEQALCPIFNPKMRGTDND